MPTVVSIFDRPSDVAKAVRKLQHPVRSRMLEGFLEGVVVADHG